MAELKRSLGFWTLLAMSIGAIVGTGLFIGPAIAASIAGNASIIAWVILAIIAMYVAACFGELVAIFPSAGGIYEFSKQAYGRFTSFIVGWMGWVVGNITTSLLIVAAIQYITPVEFPIIYKMILSVIFILILNTVAYMGVEASSLMLITFAVITVGFITAIIIPGFFHVNTSHLTPFFTTPFFYIFIAVFFIAETFFGWEAVANLAEETKDPEKVIPKALVLGTLIASLFAIAISFILLGVYGAATLATFSSPLLNLSTLMYGKYGVYLSAMGVYLILIGSCAVGIIASPRLLMAMSRDRLFLRRFSKIHPKFKTPYKAIVFQTIVSIAVVLVGFGNYKLLLSLLVPLALAMYILVLVAIPLLRWKKPEIKRTFKAPLGTVLPFVISAFFLALIIFWAAKEPASITVIKHLAYIMILGVLIYFLLEMYYNPKVIQTVNNLFAHVTLVTERLFFPMKVRKEIMLLLGNIRDKVVLEYGCSVGTLTILLGEAVGPRGKVYATDLSERAVRITERRLARKGYTHVRVIHDSEHHCRIHPDVPNVDVAVSIGAISNVQDLKRVLKELNCRLNLRSKILFVDYDRFFDVIPNAEWLSNDDEIKRIFHDSGFTVTVVRKQGFAWQYIYIYGVKFENKKVRV